MKLQTQDKLHLGDGDHASFKLAVPVAEWDVQVTPDTITLRRAAPTGPVMLVGWLMPVTDQVVIGGPLPTDKLFPTWAVDGEYLGGPVGESYFCPVFVTAGDDGGYAEVRIDLSPRRKGVA